MRDNLTNEKPRQRILRAAHALFASKGFHRTTTAELAAEAKVSMGQLYRQFSSKNDVVLEVVRENGLARAQEIQAIIDRISSGELSPVEAFYRALDLTLDWPEAQVFQEALVEAARDSELQQPLRDILSVPYQDTLRTLVQVLCPHTTEEDLSVRTDIAMACMMSLTHLRLLSPQTYSSDRIGRIADILLSTLIPRHQGEDLGKTSWQEKPPES